MAPAVPSSTPGKVRSCLQRLFWSIWSPSRTFQALRDRPAWHGAFLLIGLGTAATTWLTVPIFQEISLAATSQSLSTDQLEQAARINRIAHAVATLGTFLTTLAYWFVSALLIWLILQVFAGLTPFRTVFAVVAHANVVSLVSSLLVTALILVKLHCLHGGPIEPHDLMIRLGLDLLVEGEPHPSLKVLLASLNPFSLWYYGLLVLGVGTVARADWPRATGVVVVFWVLCMAFGAGIAWIAGALTAPSPQLG